ncbi:NADH-ubiquinone oxidoreductase B12 subunit family-domain-containing protein [Hypoxylon trugodes]|uniref:NADH-ubiquinone oxidoreductase B12 subunit family-domain-containing protein n=1 Tax=Hypoxylon trugodes TaxID=326681 RepID=UPI00219F1019|nr:NADH-ubiquinone oxidoreductase B12 subunit family-domain-containing protein [Hypoxylon trugodes]KAI1393910.1 NADH-ubiquinone oxidoreductase B12 subunit family-domain-containing protein [Hypoxylon trugodes]
MYPTRILRAHGEKPNITGFDVRKFAHSAGQPRYDPWERASVNLYYSHLSQSPSSREDIKQEAWRYTGQFSRWNRFKNGFPGLGIATVAFAVYLGYEHFFLKDDHHHGEGHGEEHH